MVRGLPTGSKACGTVSPQRVVGLEQSCPKVKVEIAMKTTIQIFRKDWYIKLLLLSNMGRLLVLLKLRIYEALNLGAEILLHTGLCIGRPYE